LYSFFEFNSIVFIYYLLTKEKKSHQTIIFSAIFFNSVYFLSFIYTSIQNYSPILLGILVSVFVFLYLKELLNSDKIINFKTDISFWISVGFLIFYLASIPFFTLLFIIGMADKLLFYILQIMITITHITFIIGLLCSKKTVRL